MQNETTVRITGAPAIDHDAVMRALSALSGATTMEDVSAAVQAFGSAVGMPSHLLMHMVGQDGTLHAAAHNLRETVDVDALARHPVTLGLIARRLPVVLDGQIEVGELRLGVAVAAPHGTTTCVLMLGGAAVPEADLLGELVGLAVMAAVAAADRLAGLAAADCPLTARERDCLRLAAEGLSAKETARELGLSPRTVEEYIANSRKRLGAATTLEAMVTASRKGWLRDARPRASGVLKNRRQYGAG